MDQTEKSGVATGKAMRGLDRFSPSSPAARTTRKREFLPSSQSDVGVP